jgi:hypothetical protein
VAAQSWHFRGVVAGQPDRVPGVRHYTVAPVARRE